MPPASRTFSFACPIVSCTIALLCDRCCQELPSALLRKTRLRGPSTLDPRVPSAFEREGVRIAELAKFERHTGAGGLVLSGAVGDDDLVFGRRNHGVECLEKVRRLDADGIRDLLVVGMTAHVEHHDRLALIEPMLEVSH